MNTKFIYLLITSLLFSPKLFSQEQPGLRERADVLYNEYQYAKAAVIYQKLVDKKHQVADMQKLAICYLKMKDYNSAEKLYGQLVSNPKSTIENMWSFAEVLKANAKYSEAKKAFETYAQKIKNNKHAAIEIAGCDSALKWIANPTAHKIKNQTVINTGLSEFSVYPLDKQLLYTQEPTVQSSAKTYGWTGKSFLKVSVADRLTGDSLKTSVQTTYPFNDSRYHVGPVISNKKGNIFYVTRSAVGKNEEISKEQSGAYKTRNLELVVYSRDSLSGKWLETPFKFSKPQLYSVGHAALSPDEKILYFVSDMPGGQGGTDIWFAELNANGSWGNPQNAGKIINTATDELFPSIAQDGTLYFSTKGYAGMGGMDIFKSSGKKTEWKMPVNLKSPINSSRDDFGLALISKTEEGEFGYVSSDREGGKGEDDIYSFNNIVPKQILALKATTINKKTKAALSESSLALFTQNHKLVKESKSQPDGSVYFELAKNSTYTLVGRKESFLPDSAVITTKGITKSDTIEVALNLDPLYKGKTIKLENVHYDLGKHDIREDAALILNELELTMRENPTMKIELSSHTDSRGNDAYNKALSQRRAQSAVDYLVSRGIAKSRMLAKGYGESRLMNKCGNNIKCSEEEHQANRRTEIKILSF